MGIKIKVTVNGEIKDCEFKESYERHGMHFWHAEETFLVRYRTGKKLHSRRPSFVVFDYGDNANQIPDSLVFDANSNRLPQFGNSASIEIPVRWAGV